MVLNMAGVGVGLGYGRFTLAFLIPAMSDDILDSFGSAGFLGAINLGTYLIGLLIVSTLARHSKPEQLLVIATAGSVVGLAVMSVASGFAMLVIGMALTGLFAAGVWVPSIGVVSAAVPEHRRGLALGLVVSGFGLAILSTGLLVKLARSIWGEGVWRQVWALQAGLGVVVLILIVLFLPSSGQTSGPAPVTTMKALLQVPRWGAIITAYAASAVGYILYLSYLVTMLEKDAGFSADHASTLLSVFGLMTAVGGFAVGGVSDRAGRRPILIAGNILLAGCTLLTLVGQEPWVAVSVVLTGVLVTGMGTTTAAYISDYLSPRTAVAAFGVITVPFGVLQAASPPLGGLLADWTGTFTATFVISAAAYAITAAASTFLAKGKRQQKAPEPKH